MDFQSLAVLFLTLVEDTAFSWARMFAALAISVVLSIGIGIYAATNRKAEGLILPLVDILQTLPILAFFPFVIFIMVATIPGALGINLAVVFLIITSMVWNIIFGVYESIKTLPKEYLELARLYGLSRLETLERVYIPACMPRVVEQSILSWSIGLFYLVTSEIFSTGSSQYAVKVGIGAAIASPAITGSLVGYSLALLIFVGFVVATRLFFFKPWEEYVTRYNRHDNAQSEIKKTFAARDISSMRIRIMKRLGAGRIGSIGKRIGSIGNRKGKEAWTGVGGNEKGGRGVWRYPLLGLLVLGVLAIIATHSYLIGYEGIVLKALAYSFARVWLAFAISLGIGIPVCVYLIFITRHSSKYLMLFQIIASVPATILLPAIVNSLRNVPGSGELIAEIVFVLSCVWYIIFSTMNIAKTLPSNIAEVKGIFGIKGTEAWRKIYLRAIIPGLITGSITGIAAEWNASIVAEYFTVGSTVVSQVGTGIGKLLNTSLASNNLVLMLVALINLTVMIIILNTFLWRRLYGKVSKMYG